MRGEDPKPPRCRLCGSKLEFKFSKLVLRKNTVSYFQCTSCLSLQTETPYWLDEAYSEVQPNFDTGAVRRTLYNVASVILISRLFSIKAWQDQGGGNGMLARTLRDYNLNAQSSDKYLEPSFTRGITAFGLGENDGLSCFEVLEHLPNPSKELAGWLHERVRVAILSTEIYCGQGEDWQYLSPENGQHVFFYSKEALKLVANKNGLQVEFLGIYIVMFRELPPWKKHILRILLSKVGVHLMRVILFAANPQGPERDLAKLLEN